MVESKEPFFREKNAILTHFIIPYLGAVIVAAIWVRFSDLPSLFRAPSRPALFVWSAVGLLSGVVVNRAGLLVEGYSWYKAMVVWMKRMLRQALGPRIYFSDALLIGLYSSVGEEAFFRGALQPWLIRWSSEISNSPDWGIVLGVLGTSITFGVMHAPLVRELRPWTVLAVVMGGVFGLLAVFSGSLLPPILAHMTINFLNLLRLNEIAVDQEDAKE
jgi:uncharacterized protein